MNKGDRIEDSRWELHDAMFSVDHMLNRVTDYANEREMSQTLKAINLMKKYHEGQTRKGKDEVPYIIHPLMLACHAFALGIASDELIAACLLHDVLEDCDAKPEDLDVTSDIVDVVKLVSYEQLEGFTEENSKKLYYNNISKNRIASMVKLLDRCNNISTMATGFNRAKMAEYIDETEAYVMPLLNTVKHEYDEYYNASFLLKYHIKSVIESLKRTL